MPGEIRKEGLGLLLRAQAIARALRLESQELDYPQRLLARRFGVLSQHEEDGIILALLAEAGDVLSLCVEIGCGTNGGNSGFLIRELDFRGVLIDADPDATRACRTLLAGRKATVVEALIDSENVDQILIGRGLTGEIDLLSIDIDGIDLWVWLAITAVQPRIVCIEFNSAMPAGTAVPYDPAFNRRATGVPESLRGMYFGASLAALVTVGNDLGMRLVAVDPTGVNAFFMRADVAPHVPELRPDDAHVMYSRHARAAVGGFDLEAAVAAAGIPLARSFARQVGADVTAQDRPGTEWKDDDDLESDARRSEVDERRRLFKLAAEHSPYLAVETEVGTFLVRTTDQNVGVKLFVNRTRREIGVVARCADLLESVFGADAVQGRIFVEVGANIGTTTVPALSLCGFARAIAFEPEDENCLLLRLNVLMNGVEEGLILIPKAVSDRSGVSTLVLTPGSSGKHFVVRGRAATKLGDRPSVQIETVTLDQLASESVFEPRDVGLLWMDAQGHEGKVLAGAKRLTSRGTPVLLEWGFGAASDSSSDSQIRAITAERYTHFVDLMHSFEPLVVSRFEEYGQSRSRGFADLLFFRYAGKTATLQAACAHARSTYAERRQAMRSRS